MSAYAGNLAEVLDHFGFDSVDVLGTHTGAVEAAALAQEFSDRVGTVGLVAIPAFNDEEIARGRSTLGEPRPDPSEDGRHLMDLWERRLTYRDPPYHLDILTWRTAVELQAVAPHRAYRAVYDYPLCQVLRGLSHRIVAFAPHDDLAQITARSRACLPRGAVYVDLPEMGLDLFALQTSEVAALIDEHIRSAPEPRQRFR